VWTEVLSRVLTEIFSIDQAFSLDTNSWTNGTLLRQKKLGGGTILQYYNNSPSTALKTVYPEHNWEIWKFKMVPMGYWEQSQHRTTFFDRLFETLGYKSMNDLYNVTADDIVRNGGFKLLNYYSGSPSKALQSAYPEHIWEIWRFDQLPMGFWEQIENHKEFFDRLYKLLGFTSMDDWYNISFKDIERSGGAALTKQYNFSPSKALQSVYPEHNWMSWRFKTTPQGYLEKLSKDPAEAKKLIDWVGMQVSVKQLEDWYRVSMGEIQQWVDIPTANHLTSILTLAYPQHEWNTKQLNRIGLYVKASQRQVILSVQKLFPTHGNLHSVRSGLFCSCGRGIRSPKYVLLYWVSYGVGCFH